MINITQAHPEIAQYIDFKILTQYLNRYRIFTANEIHHLGHDPIEDSANNLIDWLSRKDEDGVLNFVKALNDAKEHSGHTAILRKLNVKVIQGKVYDIKIHEHT